MYVKKPGSKPTLLHAAERAATPESFPAIKAPHRWILDYKNSARAAKAMEQIAGDVMDSAASVIRTQLWADCSVRSQEVFLAYANRIKQLTPEVVQSAVQINSAIEAARPRGYEVLDRAQKEAQAIITKSLEDGNITKEIAERRASAVDMAHADDERFFDALIAGAKMANRNIATQAVNRVASVFDGTEPPIAGRIFTHE